jgi:hypothetical protein
MISPPTILLHANHRHPFHQRLMSSLLTPSLSLTLAMFVSAAVPPTEKKPVTDEYHGVQVVDEYRWLEDGDSAAVKAWTAAQNQYSRAWLDSRA